MPKKLTAKAAKALAETLIPRAQTAVDEVDGDAMMKVQADLTRLQAEHPAVLAAINAASPRYWEGSGEGTGYSLADDVARCVEDLDFANDLIDAGQYCKVLTPRWDRIETAMNLATRDVDRFDRECWTNLSGSAWDNANDTFLLKETRRDDGRPYPFLRSLDCLLVASLEDGLTWKAITPRVASALRALGFYIAE